MTAPSKGRPTTQQLIAVSRALDIEDMYSGRPPHWEKRLSEAVSQTPYMEDFMTFRKLVHMLDTYGINPEVSYLQAGISPASINNGTHRMGYSIVNFKANHFVPVRAGFALWYPVDGITFYKERGITDEEISILMERYTKALEDIGHDYIVLVDEMHTKSDLFPGIFSKIGFTAISDAIEMVNPEYKDRTDYKKFLAKLKDIQSIRVMKLPLYSQFLMYKKRKVVSRESEEIDNIFTEAFGRGWGIVPSCMTESISIKIFLEIFYCFDTERL